MCPKRDWDWVLHTYTQKHMHRLAHKQVGDLIGWCGLCVPYITAYLSHRWLGKSARCPGNTKQRVGTSYAAMMWGDYQWWRVPCLTPSIWRWEGLRERTEGVWGESWTFCVSLWNLSIDLSLHLSSSPFTSHFVKKGTECAHNNQSPVINQCISKNIVKMQQHSRALFPCRDLINCLKIK